MGTRSNKLTEVQIIRRGSELDLVQWTNSLGILQRSWVVRANLVDDTGSSAQVANPEQGVPYGVEFHRLIKLKATSVDLDRELKQRGIWTVEDVRARPKEVVGALTAVYGVDLAALLQAASRYEKELATEA